MNLLKTKLLLSFLQSHKAEIRNQFLNFSLGVNSIEEDPFECFFDSSSCGDNQTQARKEPWPLLLLGLMGRGGGGGSSSTPVEINIQSLGLFLNKLDRMLNNLLFGSERGLTYFIFQKFYQSSRFVVDYFWFLIPIPFLYLMHKYIVFIYNRYRFTLQYRAPSHRFCYVENFDYQTENQGIIILRDFLETKTEFVGSSQPKVQSSNYMKYAIPAYYRLLKLCESFRLGLVCVNRLNLVFDTVHRTYAGAGLKCIIEGIYSSILVQIRTAVYSPQDKRKVYILFNILVIGGIGVVVWYKFVNHFPEPFLIPEPHGRFLNPTAVVEGYKKVTFWITDDLNAIVLNAFLREPPFREIIPLNQYWGPSMIEKDRVTYIGLAIMIATFITTGILKTAHPMLA